MKVRSMQKALFVFLVGSAATLFWSPILAQSADQSFAMEAASEEMVEVKLGQLAQQNGVSEAVRQFGKRMETDYSVAGDKLRVAASRNNILLASTMSESDQATYTRLSKLSGPEFDEAYAKDMVKGLQKKLVAFRKEATKGRNSDIKQFASDILVVLQDHLKAAKEIAKTTSVD